MDPEKEEVDSDAESQYPSEFESDASSKSSSDSSDQIALDNVFDKEFFKCYSALKRKDPRIYDKNFRFFNEPTETQAGASSDDNITSKGNKKEKKGTGMTLMEYQIKTATEPLNKPIGSKYERELDDIKAELLAAAQDIDKDDGDLLVVKKRVAETKNNDPLENEHDDQDIVYLKSLWNAENLDEREKFMRDFITKMIYLSKPSELENYDQCANVKIESSDMSKSIPHSFKSAEELEEINPTVPDVKKVKYHSEESNFNQVARIPRNATNTIRDMERVSARNEARRKKREQRRKERAQLLGQLKSEVKTEDEPILSKKEMKKKKIKEPAPYEDIVAGLPTKFKYRETIPNDFGLTNEELLFATDEELNKWASLRKTVLYRTREQEIFDVKAYKKKASNLTLKKKIFKSLYGSSDDETDDKSQIDFEGSDHVHNTSDPMGVMKGKKRKHSERDNDDETREPKKQTTKASTDNSNDRKQSKKKKHKRGLNHKRTKSGLSEERLLAYGLSKKRLKKSKLL